VLGICRKRHAGVDEAEEDVREFLELTGIELVPITAVEAETALSAFSRYGKGRGHPAQIDSTSAIVLLTLPPKTTAERFCSRAMISTRPISALRLVSAHHKDRAATPFGPRSPIFFCREPK
jgi:hypothetical protein